MLRVLITLSLAFSLSAAPAHAEGFLAQMKKAAQAGANPVLRGRVMLADGRTLTCFENIKTGYLGPPDIKAPSYTVRDGSTGTITVRTGAIPAYVMLPPATLTDNDCDKLAAMGVLRADGASAASAAAAPVPPPAAPASLIEEGAKVCRVEPSLIASLEPEAMKFVRVDRAKSLVIMSEKAGGRRQEIALDQQAFAQKSIGAAGDMSLGSVKCGMAFWDAQAVKQATAAINAGR
jgi:hypothetical protein